MIHLKYYIRNCGQGYKVKNFNTTGDYFEFINGNTDKISILGVFLRKIDKQLIS